MTTEKVDVTERGEVVERHHADDRFRFLAESMPQKIFTATPSGDVDYFNPQWTAFTGLSFEEIRGWGWTQFIHPDDVEENIRRWRHSLETGDPFEFEHRFRRKDGVYRWHLSRAHPMRDADGTILLWIGSNTDIDDQKRAEEERDRARTETEAQRMYLHDLFVQAPAIICVLRGPEHVYELANPGYLHLVGHRDIVGKPIREALPELEAQGFIELLDRVYATGEPFVGNEVRVSLDRGRETLEEVYFNFVYQPFRNKDGAVDGILVHAVEVTEQVRARQLLEGERGVLEMIAQGAALDDILNALARFIETRARGALCSILLLDRDGRHLRHGAAPSLPQAYNEAIDGISVGPAVGSCGTAAYRGESVVVTDIATDPLWDHFRDLALRHGLRACWSTPIRASDGHVLGTFALYHRHAIAPSLPERETVDVLTYLASVAIERRRLEEERGSLLTREHAARAEAETMLEQIADAVIVIDATGRSTYLNGAAKTLLGVDATGVSAERRSEVYGMVTPQGEPFRAEELPSMQAMRHRRTITGVDMRVRRPDGREIPVQENAAPIVAEDGRVVGAIATVRDISAQRELERQKEAFLATVAHDLKNPVAVLQGQAQLLRRRAALGTLEQDQVIEGLQLVEGRARMMTGLIDQLLDVTRLRLGQELQLERQPVDLVAVVHEIVREAQRTTDHHELRVVTAMPELVGDWDRQRLVRIIENLLNNAIKYSPDGDITVSIAQGERGDAVVTVQDHGIGIPAKDLPHVFEQFYRAENAAGRIAGTGIGLAGARQIVEQHGGTLTAESEEGVGSAFTIRLPLHRPDAAPSDGADTNEDSDPV